MEGVVRLVRIAEKIYEWAEAEGRAHRRNWVELRAAIDQATSEMIAGLSDPSIEAPGAHTRDPADTSKAAAYANLPGKKTLRMAVLQLIEMGPRTDDEIEAIMGRVHQSVSARRRELVLGGWIEDSGSRRLTRSGEEAIVWRLTFPGEMRLMEARYSDDN